MPSSIPDQLPERLLALAERAGIEALDVYRRGFEVRDELYQEFLHRVGRTTFRKP